MGGFILWMYITVGGNVQLLQDRFESRESCEAAVYAYKSMAKDNFAMNYKDHRCVDAN